MIHDELARLVRTLDPQRTILLFGAGATYSSGAPLSLDLCRHLEKSLANGEHISDDLSEVASILELRTTRRQVINAVVERLRYLKPDEALIALARYEWPSIYSTNYDLLLEAAFERAQRSLSVVRSHYDWESAHSLGTTLYKLHGCITQDRALGHRSSMIITAEDYVQFEEYRNLLFDRLRMELAGGSACVIGHSLKDPHLIALLNEAVRLQRRTAAPGRIHLVLHDFDPERATLWRSRGLYSVVPGGLNEFVQALAAAHTPLIQVCARGGIDLPHRLAACTINVKDHTGQPNPRRLFFGASASYPDIAAGYTFERDIESDLRVPNGTATIITGVAGTGKTTLARRLIMDHLTSSRWLAYEHRPEFPLEPDEWLQFENTLRDAKLKAVLLIDNCVAFQPEVNFLARRLPDDSALHLILTAETSAWKVRQKERRLFSHSKTQKLSTLSEREIHSLVHVVTNTPGLRDLVEPSLLSQSTQEQERILLRKCSADMFVCLKALFSSETLDDILLREYANLDGAFQEVYRTTAALEAAGTFPHRQMILRITNLSANLIAAALDVLEGIVEEEERDKPLGIYIWRTRHEIVAELISRYKYSAPAELRLLLEYAITSANPTYFVEAHSLREMCNARYGIRALPSREDRLSLYRAIVKANPVERVARHRLIAELLDDGRIGDAEAELRNAIDDVGLDPPLQRYQVRLGIVRSRGQGLLLEDRKAILQSAMNEAERGIERFKDNKYMYFAAADVAEEWFYVTKERGLLEWAKLLLQNAEKEILDPDIGDRMRGLGTR